MQDQKLQEPPQLMTQLSTLQRGGFHRVPLNYSRGSLSEEGCMVPWKWAPEVEQTSATVGAEDAMSAILPWPCTLATIPEFKRILFPDLQSQATLASHPGEAQSVKGAAPVQWEQPGAHKNWT